MDPDIVMHQYIDNQHGGGPYHESVGTFLWIVYSRNHQQDTVAYLIYQQHPATILVGVHCSILFGISNV